VARAYQGVKALQGVDLEVREGEVLGLIGPNGAGKTTLVNVMTGFDRPNSGTVTLDDRDITSWRPRRRLRAGLARTFQHGHLFGRLSARENVAVAALAAGATRRDADARAEELLGDLGLADRADEPAAALGHGDERKVGVARALASRPRYVLMDEPAAGLAEPEIPALRTVLDDLRNRHGVGVLLVDHNVPLIMSICDRVHVLDQGRTLAEGSPDEIRANLDVTAAYLGGSPAPQEGQGG
jgi:branched-chain amino acid transport system ATP-binding protein